ncbi:MAG: hypothetical protein N2247_05790 [Leptospiraceae bacterium]|nr:hypothetical protein [Leptospiraceae bacterium]
MKNKLIFIIVIFIFLFCKLQNEEDKKKNELIQTLLLNSINSNCKVYSLSEEPTFTELHQKNVFENCLKCHNYTMHEGNLNLNDYNQTKIRVVPYAPQESLLYQTITIGSMKDYSNSCTNDAVRKWIQYGAKE